MLGSACFLLQLIGEGVLHDNAELVLIKNIGKLFYLIHVSHMPPAASELEFALCNFSEVLWESIYT